VHAWLATQPKAFFYSEGKQKLIKSSSYIFLISLMPAIFLAHLIPLDVITLLISCEQFEEL
jgi:hypothetical protein